MIVEHFPSAADGIRCEEALLAERRPAIRLWVADEPALVIPASHERRADVAELKARAKAEGWPILARSSGGGVVPQGPQTLNLAMALLHAAILIHLHEQIPWSLIERLQGVSAAASTSPITKDAHVSLDDLLPVGAGERSFPGALMRAGEDRLRSLQPRTCQAA